MTIRSNLGTYFLTLQVDSNTLSPPLNRDIFYTVTYLKHWEALLASVQDSSICTSCRNTLLT